MDSNQELEDAEPATGYVNRCESSGTKSGTIDARAVALQALIDAWPKLPDSTVNQILRLVRDGSGLAVR